MDGLPADAAQELAGLEAKMENPREWFHNHAGQERYRQLVEAEEAGTAAPAKPSANAQRVAEIEEAMKDTNGEYWHSEKLQAEYRSLVETKDAGGSEAISDPRVARLRAALAEGAAEVGAAYLGLSDSLRTALEVEYPDHEAPSQPASAQDITTLAETDHGRLLTAQWGDDTARLLGVAISRMARIEQGMSEDDLMGWRDFFFNRLQPHERAAVVDYLVQ